MKRAIVNAVYDEAGHACAIEIEYGAKFLCVNLQSGAVQGQHMHRDLDRETLLDTETRAKAKDDQ